MEKPKMIAEKVFEVAHYEFRILFFIPDIPEHSPYTHKVGLCMGS